MVEARFARIDSTNKYYVRTGSMHLKRKDGGILISIPGERIAEFVWDRKGKEIVAIFSGNGFTKKYESKEDLGGKPLTMTDHTSNKLAQSYFQVFVPMDEATLNKLFPVGSLASRTKNKRIDSFDTVFFTVGKPKLIEENQFKKYYDFPITIDSIKLGIGTDPQASESRTPFVTWVPSVFSENSGGIELPKGK